MVLYVMYNRRFFEWDEKKHTGVDFEIASLACDRLLGKGVLLVVPVYRGENPNGEEVIRIISAREADPRERRIYLEQTAY